MPKTKKPAKKKRNSKNEQLLKRLLNVRGFAFFMIFAAVGAALVLLTRAAIYDANASCGKRVASYTYRVPWGDAVWNKPVCGLPRHPQSADYAARFYNWSNVNDGTPATQSARGKLSIGANFPQPLFTDPEGLSGLFSRNVYYAKNATTTKKIWASVYPSNLDGIKSVSGSEPDRLKYQPDNTIPWNPSWRTGEGGDNEIVILDEPNGRIYEISGYKRDLAAVTQCGPFVGDRLCAYTVNIGRDYNGAAIDYRTFMGPLNRRGVGLSMYQTLVTPEEVKAGEIRHAMGVSIPNTATGPICSAAQLGTAAEGKTCGTAVAPATKFEWGGVKSMRERNNVAPQFLDIYTQDKLIPEGMRFALDIDDAYIEKWISTRTDLTTNPKKAETARIFARALRDYGFLIVDTSGAGAGVQVAGMVNPQARQLWNDVGISSDADDNLLNGLVRQDKLYVVDAPVSSCQGGTTSKYYCQWTKSEYKSSVASPSTSGGTTGTTVGGGTAPTGSTPTGPDFIPPSVPGDLRASLTFDWTALKYTIALNWKPSVDDRKVAGYTVRRDGVVLATPTSTAVNDQKDLVADKRYTYTVQARDEAGNVSPATSKSVTGSCFLVWCTLR